nr:class I SAM-dependent methyltransferase [Actinomycetota bacterium]
RYGPPVSEPARWGLRRNLLDLMDKVHLARPAVQAYELALAASRSTTTRGVDTAGLPLPPARLRAQIGPSHADARVFLESGRAHAELIRGLLSETGTSVEELEAMLDWGCGCGRVLRHWSGLEGTRVFGCDINPKMVEWCRDNLPFADVTVTGLAPPLPYGDGAFDLMYAFSVFTHLAEDLQHEWIRECLRVLKPGGFLLLSTMGEYYLSRQRLSESEEEAFRRGELIVLYEGAAGTSLCSAYHPPDYVQRRLAGDFEVAAFRPAADEGQHDIHLLRKPVPST